MVEATDSNLEFKSQAQDLWVRWDQVSSDPAAGQDRVRTKQTLLRFDSAIAFAKRYFYWRER